MNQMNHYNELNTGERITLSCRRIFESYGYTHFKMSKFERYDLYAQNKDFLLSENIITFTDIGGKLMALKPDVTMSIIKNSDYRPGGATEKYYYNESVYRTKADTHSFGELLQTGVECIGDVGEYETAEILMMAVRSLAAVADNYVLDVSHMGVVTSVLSRLDMGDEEKHELIKCISEKSVHGVARIADGAGISEEMKNALSLIIECSGPIAECAVKLKEAFDGFGINQGVDELCSLASRLSASGLDKNVRLDFSVVYDRAYYNGIVFRGFVEGVPERVLSGGRYDLLLARMGKRGGGIGFAIYADSLLRLDRSRKIPYTDVLILYSDSDDVSTLCAAVEGFISEGKTVLTAKNVPERREFGRIVRFNEGKLTEVETK